MKRKSAPFYQLILWIVCGVLLCPVLGLAQPPEAQENSQNSTQQQEQQEEQQEENASFFWKEWREHSHKLLQDLGLEETIDQSKQLLKETFQEHGKHAVERLDELQNEFDHMFEEDLSDMLSTELVTINSRQAQTIDRVPNIVTIITRDQILHSGARTLADVLNTIPGFFVKNTNTFNYEGSVPHDSFVMRGIPIGGTRNVLFMLNGHRLNSAFTGGLDGTLPYMPLFNVERIEVIRGPGSARYGTGAFMGVINVITSLGDEMRGGIAQTGLRSNHGFEQGVAYGDKLEQGAYSLHGYYYQDQGEAHHLDLFDDYQETVYDGRQLANLFADVRWQRFSLSLAHYQHDNDPYITHGHTHHRDEPNNFNQGFTQLFKLSYEMPLAEGSLLFETKYNRNQSDYAFEFLDDRYTHALLEAAGLTASETSVPRKAIAGIQARERRLENRLHLLYRAGDSHVLEGGLVYAKEQIDDYNVYHNFEVRDGFILETDFDKQDFKSDLFREIWGFYLQDNIELTEQVSAYMGGRYDDYSDVGNTFNPRAGLVYRITEQHVLKALFSSAFRAPSFRELYFFNENAEIEENRLKPERSEVTELAYLFGISKSHKFRLSAYYAEIKDMIFYDVDDTLDATAVEAPGDSIQFRDDTLSNLGKLINNGYELEFKLEFTPVHTLDVNISRVFSQVLIENESFSEFNNFMTPQTMANLMYTIPLDQDVVLNTQALYRLGFITDTESQEVSPPHTLVNAHLSLKWPTLPALTVFMGAHNIADTRVDLATVFYDYEQRGREFQGGMRYRF